MTRNKLFPFFLWLFVFYTVWVSLVVFGDRWSETLAHWPIALAMTLGSYVAGSTPMGGGTVGFPVLVLLFDLPGALGRNFGLAIQSIGMVSASIYIISLRKSVAWGLLRPALAGSLIGTPVGAAFVAPFVPDIWIKLTFAIVWASFGVMHILKMRELVGALGQSRKWDEQRISIGLIIGFLGGIVASVTGVGIDMIVYATLVLLYRTDLKIAIPTSVILMAFTSVVGIFVNMALSSLDPELYKIDPEVYANWLAAAPVVALGAPLGAFIVSLISRTPTLILVSLLCIAQFFWTIVEEGVSGFALLAASVAVMICVGIFQFLYQLGRPD